MGCNKAGLIIRGTTPTIVITYKTIDVSDIIEAYLTIKQEATNIEINKTLTDATILTDQNALGFMLTQEDTLSFEEKSMLKLQCRYLLQDGSAGASAKFDVSPYDILRDGVIQ